MTLSRQAFFGGESDPNFPWGKKWCLANKVCKMNPNPSFRFSADCFFYFYSGKGPAGTDVHVFHFALWSIDYYIMQWLHDSFSFGQSDWLGVCTFSAMQQMMLFQCLRTCFSFGLFFVFLFF